MSRRQRCLALRFEAGRVVFPGWIQSLLLLTVLIYHVGNGERWWLRMNEFMESIWPLKVMLMILPCLVVKHEEFQRMLCKQEGTDKCVGLNRNINKIEIKETELAVGRNGGECTHIKVWKPDKL